MGGTNKLEYRQLGGSGLKVPPLSFGTATFGGGSEFFWAWGTSTGKEASQLIDIALDASPILISDGFVEENPWPGDCRAAPSVRLHKRYVQSRTGGQ
jgi:hypothetical protein